MSGIEVARFLIRLHRDQNKSGSMHLKILIIVLSIRFAIFILLNEYVFGIGWMGKGIAGITFTIIGQFFYNITLLINVLFLRFSISNLKRKKFFMIQLTYLLSLSKNQQFEGWKIMPSINFLCPVSMKSWLNLRKILIDYGKGYDIRNNLNVSIFFLIYLLIGTYTTLGYLGILKIDQNSFILIYFDIALIFAHIFYLFYLGAEVNNHF
jgi:hypothetical protein